MRPISFQIWNCFLQNLTINDDIDDQSLCKSTEMADRQADQIFVDTVGQTSNSHFLRSHHNHQHCHLMAMEITAKKYKYKLSSGNASSTVHISHHAATTGRGVHFSSRCTF